LDSADCWVSHNASIAPAFVASRAGYDVWLGNSRGNKYSHDHINTKIAKKDYWAFSFQQMGEHDIPAVLTYIKQVTGQQKVAYVGHSQGTSQLFYALATNEDYFVDKLSVFVALGPVMRLTHCKSSLL
jgi:predicted alpha/beta hydrolase